MRLANRRRDVLLRLGAATAAAICVAATSRSFAYDWLQFNGDPAHSGHNRIERAIARSNVATLAVRFQATLPATADGAPVVVRNVVTASGTRDLLFVTTVAGHLVALDAKTGAPVWSRQHGPGSCRINNGSSACYTTSSPAVDPSRQFVYGYGLDGYVHKHQIGDGAEVTAGGWPQLATLKGFDEKGSSALAFATSQGTTWLYVVHGGYPGDNGDYQGHVTAINLATGAQHVFNTMCSDQAVHLARLPASPNCASPRSAIWARPAVVYDAALDRIFMATGNGSYNGNTGGHNWSESIIALAPDGTGAGGVPLDAYTPTNFQSLDNADADLGSTAPAILPVPPAATPRHLALQAGKDAKLRLVNLADLSGAGGPGHLGGEVAPIVNLPQGGGVLTQPAVWVNPVDGATWAFVANGNGISGVRLQVDALGAVSLVAPWSNAQGGASPLVANNLLFYAASGALRALDPATGIVLWSSSQVGAIHWQSPVVANGIVYVSDGAAHLTAFAPAVVPTANDFDFTGRTDLLWRDAVGGATSLWLMNGLAATGTATLLTDGNWTVHGGGDFNGDGRADLVWRNASTGQVAIWLMNGPALTSGAIVVSDPAWTVTHGGDFDGDGKGDLVWRNATTGATAVWLLNGTALASGRIVMTDANWSVVGVGDFNGDGGSDLVWHNAATGQTAIWLMKGTTFEAGSVVLAHPDWTVTHVGDFDGDGRSDLVWRNGATGQTAIWLMNGTAYAAGAIVMNNGAWTVARLGDFDGDGRTDIAWRNLVTGETALWLMNGTAMASGAVVVNDASWSATHVGDWNGDGRSDLFWQDAGSGGKAIWLMNGLTLQQGATFSPGAGWQMVNPQ
jgi:outer membrane protein assembly factor BamB